MKQGQAHIEYTSEKEAYTPVQGNAVSLFSAEPRIAGSSGQIEMSAIISWEIPGGISGEYGWVKPSGRQLVPFPMDETLPPNEITARLAEEWKGAKGGHLNKVEWCVAYN